MSRPLFVKVAGTQKPAKDVFVKKDGEFKRAKLIYTKVNGEWRHQHEKVEIDRTPGTCQHAGSVTYLCPCGDSESRGYGVLPLDPNKHTGKLEFNRVEQDLNTNSYNSCHNVISNWSCCGVEVSSSEECNCDAEAVSAPSTCLTEGHMSQYCSICGRWVGFYTIPKDPNNHEGWGYTREITPSTCSTHGTGIYWLSCCGDQGDPVELELDPTNHEESEDYIAKEPTCTESGDIGRRCSGCGYGYGSVDSIPALGHQFGVVYDELVSPGSCTEDRVGRWKCLRPGCNAYEDRIIEYAHHSWQEATCTTPKTCTVCGLQEGDALDHKWEWDTFGSPTCDTPGYHVYVCSRCEARKEVDSEPSLHSQLQPGDICSVCGYQAPIHGS